MGALKLPPPRMGRSSGGAVGSLLGNLPAPKSSGSGVRLNLKLPPPKAKAPSSGSTSTFVKKKKKTVNQEEDFKTKLKRLKAEAAANDAKTAVKQGLPDDFFDEDAGGEGSSDQDLDESDFAVEDQNESPSELVTVAEASPELDSGPVVLEISAPETTTNIADAPGLESAPGNVLFASYDDSDSESGEGE